jgi:hypothetical protein
MNAFVKFIAGYFILSALIRLWLLAKGDKAPRTPTMHAVSAVEYAVIATVAICILSS